MLERKSKYSQIILLWGHSKTTWTSRGGGGFGKFTVGHVTKGRLYVKCPFLST